MEMVGLAQMKCLAPVAPLVLQLRALQQCVLHFPGVVYPHSGRASSQLTTHLPQMTFNVYSVIRSQAFLYWYKTSRYEHGLFTLVPCHCCANDSEYIAYQTISMIEQYAVH